MKPEVKVVSVSITDIQGSRIKSTLGIIITNRLPVAINIPKLEYNIFIDSLIVVESLYNKPVHIEPSGNSTIMLPMETLSEDLTTIYRYPLEVEVRSRIFVTQTTVAPIPDRDH